MSKNKQKPEDMQSQQKQESSQQQKECCSQDQCQCNETQTCNCKDEAQQYLALAKQVQADFENFRRHALNDIKEARVAGQKSVIEVFLPCLDTFKEAKKLVTDKNILSGIEMIEDKILHSLEQLGVKKIEAVGQKFDPHLFEAVASVSQPGVDDDVVVQEYQSGYTFNDKVIRYSKVIVNKAQNA